MNWQISDTIKQYEKPGDFNFASVTDEVISIAEKADQHFGPIRSEVE